MNFKYLYRKNSTIKKTLRGWYWKHFLGSAGSDLKIYGRVSFNEAEHVYVGKNVSINEGVVFNVRYDGKVEIGDNVHLSSGVTLNAIGLVFDPGKTYKNHFGKNLKIKSDTWIGAGAIINPGVTIGENCVIGAGSVVINDIPDNETWVGVPAHFLKKNG